MVGQRVMALVPRILILVIFAPCISGCATILSDRTYPVTIDNAGGQTYFSVTDRKNQVIHEGVTPNQVVLDAKSYPFWPAKYNITYVGSNDLVQQREVKAGFDPWLIGNIVFGGVPGTVIDGATGAMFKLPKRVTGDIPTQHALTDMSQGAQIAKAQPKTNVDNRQEAGSVIEQATYQNQPETITR